MDHFKSDNFFLNIYKDEYETPKNKNTFNGNLFNIVIYRNKFKKITG